MCRKTMQMCAAAIAVGVTVGSAQAVLHVYEPFDYATGLMDGSQNGGTGMAAGGWESIVGSQQFHAVVSPGLEFTGLPTLGNAARRADRQGNSEMHRRISTASQTALTADNSTIWFSLLVDTETSYPKGNNLTFMLATDAIDDPGKTTMGIAGGGEGIGLAFLLNTPVSGQATLTAIAVDDGVSYRSTNSIGPFTGNDLLCLAGKIDWASAGNMDTLRLFNITDPTGAEPSDTDAFAMIAADLDQAQFDTLAVGDKQRSVLDEIRFGDTFAEVMGNETPAQPGDFNSDSQVEQTDLNLLLQNWGATTVPATWTAAFDGLVDQTELNDLLTNWGAGVPGADALSASETTIPEPATLGLLLLGGLAAVRRRRA